MNKRLFELLRAGRCAFCRCKAYVANKAPGRARYVCTCGHHADWHARS